MCEGRAKAGGRAVWKQDGRDHEKTFAARQAGVRMPGLRPFRQTSMAIIRSKLSSAWMVKFGMTPDAEQALRLVPVAARTPR